MEYSNNWWVGALGVIMMGGGVWVNKGGSGGL